MQDTKTLEYYSFPNLPPRAVPLYDLGFCVWGRKQERRGQQWIMWFISHDEDEPAAAQGTLEDVMWYALSELAARHKRDMERRRTLALER